ncbi:MAG: hypothetical protein A3A57_02960 [Candidatus Woykebacteria bacterium RIFCSPLOWO2_01_FULL_41_12]|uniref:Uncharacterized protein n=1 Tax=Candidatus Woykebacteria bacterium RIFCSPLOWO2_01_FULL_41_12 TaxID=1802604 RepID=A0A1G1WWD3_9BACT|nr:MAG: hypothetical protein A3A57_02960 [Candidatus Woykebacteria bacterium RIFCSPLOWO2_01_FULL_41_12]
MGSTFQSFLNSAFLILKSLKPIFIIFFILVTLFTALFVYDRLKTNQDRALGTKLSENLNVKSSCISSLIGQNERFDFSFIFTNGNSQSIFIQKVGIDLNLLGDKDTKISSLLSTNSPSNPIGIEDRFFTYEFSPPVEISAKSSQELILRLQTTTRKAAKANPNTIVVYEGEVSFLLSPEMTNTANCKIQVRYPN